MSLHSILSYFSFFANSSCLAKIGPGPKLQGEGGTISDLRRAERDANRNNAKRCDIRSAPNANRNNAERCDFEVGAYFEKGMLGVGWKRSRVFCACGLRRR